MRRSQRTNLSERDFASVTFQVLNEQGYKNIETEQFDNVAELCAAILSKGVSLQLKRGLGREY